jgi:hypothetical protein
LFLLAALASTEPPKHFKVVLRAGIEQGGHDNNPNDLCCNGDPVITNDMPLRGINVIFCFRSL